MNMTPNNPRTEASTCKSSGTQPENGETWIARFKPYPWQKRRQRHTCKCTQIWNRTRSNRGGNRGPRGPKRAWADQPSPFRARFNAPFDLAASRAIYSTLAESYKQNSFIIRRHKTENKKQIGLRREHSCPSSTSGDSTPWSALQWVTLWGKVLLCPRSWRGILSCNHQTYVLNLLLSYSCSCWWCFNLIARPACFGYASLVASLSCSFCSLCDYRRVVTMRGRENTMNLVHTFDHACLEQINVLCTWCSITDYPRVVTSMREGKGWTPCTFTFDILDRVVLALWFHLQVILDPLDKRSTFLRSPFYHSLLCLL
jgi:hypothetical protein